MFNGPEFSSRMAKLLFVGDLDEFDKSIVDAEFPIEETKRIENLLKLYQDVKAITKQKKYSNAKKIFLSEFDDNLVPFSDMSILELIDRQDGLYSENKSMNRLTTFESDLKNTDPVTRGKLISCGFDAKILNNWNYKYRVMSDVQICAEDKNIYACISKNKYYDRNLSGRVAKACSVNFVRDIKEVIDKAIILPVPHHTKNYYHAMSEMGFSLRTCTGTDIPIIHADDEFNIMPFLADLLNISTERMIPFSSAKHLKIKKAIMPHPSSFTWEPMLFDFFRQLLTNKYGAVEPFLNLYISRRYSSQGPENEVFIERELAKSGFVVVYPEYLSIEEQALVFASSKVIVAPHGAGLTNILFTKNNTALIEIFDSSFVCRDYYLRSRHNNMPYFPIIYTKTIDVDEIMSAVELVK